MQVKKMQVKIHSRHIVYSYNSLFSILGASLSGNITLIGWSHMHI